MRKVVYIIICLSALFTAAACSSYSGQTLDTDTVSIDFSLNMDSRLKAAQALDTKLYSTRLYLYERREAAGTVGYTQIKEQDITNQSFTINDLVPLKHYKAVFLAVPKGQTPALPDLLGSGMAASYEEAAAKYIDGNPSDTENDYFRSIVDFQATTANSQQSTVLTRQNGAVEVRLLSPKDLQSVKLTLDGHTSFLLQDGTGGKVITEGSKVSLEKTITDPAVLTSSEVRIRINVLPQEDITDEGGTSNYLEITTADGVTKYPLKSDHPAIPVFPNQITWLTLGGVDNTHFDVSFSGDNINLDDPQWDGFQKEEIPAGSFRVTFFGDSQEIATRAAINGGSEQIQSLLCIIYRKQMDGSYTYVDEKSVIEYKNNLIQTYQWPLQKPVTFTLPNGDYKAVFVGNIEPSLFEGQSTVGGGAGLEPILTGHKNGFTTARIHMPQKGPAAFKDYNMFYLSTVDFNQNSPTPYVLMQRIVSNNVYTRQFIDENDALNTLVNNVVNEVMNNQLTTNVVKGLLESKLLAILTPVKPVALILTSLVDRLVNALLGGLLNKLNEVLLQEVLTLVKTSLGNLDGQGPGLLGLRYVLNPWLTVDNADMIYATMAESVDFNRQACTAYKANVEWKDIPVVAGKNEVRTISVTCLSGAAELSQINVGNNGTYPALLQPILGKLDQKVVDGLLVNIHTPLKYNLGSNLQYKTVYELLDIGLIDYSNSDKTKPLTVTIKLDDIANLEQLVREILGDGLISGIVGGVTDGLLQPILDVILGSTLEFVDIRLPDLGLGNVKLNGTWDATYVSDGTIV